MNYYPRRARWYSRIFSAATRPVRRRVFWRPSGEIAVGHIILGVALPGYSFLAVRRRLLGWLCLAAWLLTAVFFVGALGFTSGSVAYGLLISFHAASIVFLEGMWLKNAGFRARLAVAFLTLFAVWGLMYQPILSYAERHWLMPLDMGDRVLIVWRGVPLQSIHRGDWLAYHIVGDRVWAENGVYLNSGMGVDPVLALPGDRVCFTPDAVFVNDKALPRAPHMPAAGELVVPEKVWFIWPSLDISGHGRAVEPQVSTAMQRIAMVTQDRIIGRPFPQWFGRRQRP